MTNLDPRGVIRSMQVNDDAVGRSVEETLRLLKVRIFVCMYVCIGTSYK